ncbi:MAG: hypothetical protein IME94_10775 [Proteobacteria bacterium]|nr:hypothetical protein [Pseudomonadota bacterium]
MKVLINIINLKLSFLFFALLFLSLSANANFLDKKISNLPEDLKQWVPWVLKDSPDIRCPILYNTNTHLCAYPSALELSVLKDSGSFSQSWDIFADSFIPLPGDNRNWPESVIVNDQSHPVVSRNKKPFVRLAKGLHNIKGHFQWNKQPKYISIPIVTGLIKLNINNQMVNIPDFRNGQLWLKTSTQSSHQNNRLDIHVFRKVRDSIPLTIETLIKIDVSGQQREVIINGALLEKFTASEINSKLPAQINAQGQLKIQVRPGQWSIKVTSFHAKEINAITLAEFNKPWPENEIWVLEQQPHLRRINVKNKTSIDANQTQLPKQWKKYPAFQMNSKDSLEFKIIKRGNPDPEPNQLNLTKNIWLDFDGNGFTVNDKISGKLSEQWRLNAADNVTLGQVTLNGSPQYITRGLKNLSGVELRHGQIDLSADSRIESDIRTLSSSGWDVDFNLVSANLYLPAGWKLFSLSGADANTSWIKRWSLLDLFIVLITAIGVFKLWGVLWGTIALSALVLTWHQPNAPQFIWINLIVVVAILRSLPSSGKIYKWLNNYRLLVLVSLAIIILPFIIHQARTALYPQLSFHSIGNQYNNYASQANKSIELKATMIKNVASDYSRMSESTSGSYSPKKTKTKTNRNMQSIDPNAMIQTGPGLPSWKLNKHRINWNGPVASDQTFSMTLIPPMANSLLNVLRIILILLLAWKLVDISTLKIKKVLTQQLNKNTTAVSSSVSFLGLAFLMAVTFMTASPLVEASFPDKEMLNELQNELNKPNTCLPQCADIESINMLLSAEHLTIDLLVHAQEDVSIPLPILINQWNPEHISINDSPVSGIFRKSRNKNHQLWLFVPKGSHSIKISGRVNYLSQLQISFPLKPHHIKLRLHGWSSEGMDQDITKVSGLSFVKLTAKQKALSDIGQSDLPVFAEISRNINLGRTWQMTTEIKGLSGTSYPVIFKIPLLEGESVLSEGVKVDKGFAIITLKRKNSIIRWNSRLNISEQIKLKAIESKQLIEKWVLNSSPTWHIEHSGIPVVYHQRQGSLWQPRWQPWAGEEVIIDVTRPKGVKGKTITIDSSTLSITPGEQNTNVSLDFNLRSSLGGQHLIQLPEHAKLQSININNKNMPLGNTAEGLSLPVLPGNQKVKIVWNEIRGISNQFKSSTINLGIESVNNKIQINPGTKRWVLFASGPDMGPAVLFWGVFIIILILSFALGRITGTPLNTMQWALLWIGLSASEPLAAIIVVGCILSLKARNNLDVNNIKAWKFNIFQLFLVFLIFISISALIFSIQQGLLGSPNMQISGNGSSSQHLNWFSDRISEIIPQVTVISVPVFIYQLLMLVWSIWLAFAVTKWALWGWKSLTHQEYWKPMPLKLNLRKSKGVWGDNESQETRNKDIS